jgi:D-alanyl-D-alanine carboxypeptidase
MRVTTSSLRGSATWRWRIPGAVILAAVLLIVFARVPAAVSGQEVPELQINSKRYIVIDADTGEIFAQRDAHDRAAMASLTKVFTAIETIESASPERTVTTSEADLVSEFASQVGFSPGETFTVEELLYGMMLPSGNDAARALARSLGYQEGDTDEDATRRFLDRMNQRVQNMGLHDTQLLDPDGWGIPGHYSSAYDLAVFTMYAIHYPRFVQAFSTLTYDTADGQYEFKNNNRMLRTYDGIMGGKTGYDDDAGWCLINVAQRDGNTMIAVTMDGIWPDDWYDDSRVLLDYGFEQKELRAANGGGVTGEIARYRDPDAAVILAMASAGGSIGQPLAMAAPVERVTALESALVAPNPPVEAITIASRRTGASGDGWLVAAAVAAALIVLQGFSTWRLRSWPASDMPLVDRPRIAAHAVSDPPIVAGD